MAALSTLLEAAIYAKAVANTTLWTSVSGRMKHGGTMAGWPFPYILYSFPNLPKANVFQSSTPVVASVTIYFDIFSANVLYAVEAGTIAGYIETVFDGTSLTMSGYQGTVIKQTNEMAIEPEEAGLFWHTQLEYKGMACPS